MKYIKTVGIYDIYEASKEECKKGYMGLQKKYPCYCAFYSEKYENETCESEDERTPHTIGNSESDFSTIKDAEEWCKEYS